MIVYVTPHSSPLTVTVAVSLVIEALPDICMWYVGIFKLGYSYIYKYVYTNYTYGMQTSITIYAYGLMYKPSTKVRSLIGIFVL